MGDARPAVSAQSWQRAQATDEVASQGPGPCEQGHASVTGTPATCPPVGICDRWRCWDHALLSVELGLKSWDLKRGLRVHNRSVGTSFNFAREFTPGACLITTHSRCSSEPSNGDRGHNISRTLRRFHIGRPVITYSPFPSSVHQCQYTGVPRGIKRRLPHATFAPSWWRGDASRTATG